ncbi:hypothetical protein RND71_021314 [Anisodus tanguticus]|uniref:Uncharacterized protein n=1 Tax=Anisodus tanguticus TaxID=243964 RepID=A0AAE1RWP9_9SOLA|nr:hypothetical protein RND71_021314 [Anisodus tanguticus]
MIRNFCICNLLEDLFIQTLMDERVPFDLSFFVEVKSSSSSIPLSTISQTS